MSYFIQIMFFGIPTIAFLFFISSLYRYKCAKKKNKEMPDSFSIEEVKKRKIMLIVSAVIAGVLIITVVSLIVMLMMAVAYM